MITITNKEYFDKISAINGDNISAINGDNTPHDQAVETKEIVEDEEDDEKKRRSMLSFSDIYNAINVVTGSGTNVLFGGIKHPPNNTLEHHINEYDSEAKINLIHQETIDKLSDDYAKEKEYNDFIDTRKGHRKRDHSLIEHAPARKEQIFAASPHRLISLDKKKITELLLDSYFAYDIKDEPVHNSTTIDNISTDTNCMIYHRNGYEVLSFRGTEKTHIQDILTNINTFSSKLSDLFDFVTPENDLIVHSGFLKAVRSVYDDIKEQIGNLIFDAAAHSLGAAEVSLFCYLFFLDTGNRVRHLITFGSPRFIIDTPEFPASRFNTHMDLIRVMNFNDMVSYIPTQDTSSISSLKMGFLGSGAGSAIGSYSGISGTAYGAGVGSLLGAGLGIMMGGNWRHVGVGILLFAEQNAVINIEGKEFLLKDKNYYILPENVDLLRNPLNIDATLAENMFYGAIWTQLNSAATTYLNTGTQFLDVTKKSFMKQLKDIFNVQFMDKLDNDMIKHLSDRRHRISSGLNYMFDIKRKEILGFRKKGVRLYADAAHYLTGKFLETWKTENAVLDDFRLDIRRKWRHQRGEDLQDFESLEHGIFTTEESEDLTEYWKNYKIILERVMNSQLSHDTESARWIYALLGFQLTSRSLIDIERVRHNYSQVQGHLFSQYFHNVGLLPEIIFDEIDFQNILDAQKVNIKDDKEISFLLDSKKNDLYKKSIQNHVLGFVFYPKNQEQLYQNKIVIY